MTTRVNLSGIDGNTGTLAESLTINAISHSTDISITSNGHVGLFVESANGNVGIGTSSPSELIHANGSAVSGLQLTTDTYTNGTVFKVQGDGASYIYNTESAILRFGTNNLERIRITASGNTGIGNTSPTDKLTVQQDASDLSGAAALKVIGTAYGTNKALHATMGTTSATKSLIYADNSNGVVLDVAGDGNIGIGTASPSSLLHLNGSNGAENFIRLHDGNSSYGYALGLGSNGDYIISKYDGGAAAEALRVKRTNGYVGINNILPTSTLDVVGDIAANAAVLKAISTTLDSGDTIDDVFVYDTSKDSDGGAWRKRTKHTSWYNEGSGTYRSARKEFPSVAIIVANRTEDRVFIYDADDPTLPIWMAFVVGSQGMSGSAMLQYTSTSKKVHMLNGILVVGHQTGSDNYGSPIINFINERIVRIDPNVPGEGGKWLGNIATRNSNSGYITSTEAYDMESSIINDIDMAVPKHASVDPSTGLPTPIIAFATDRGVSVIRSDEQSSDLFRTSDDDVQKVQIIDNKIYMAMELGALYWGYIPGSQQSGNPSSEWTIYRTWSSNATQLPALLGQGSPTGLISMHDNIIAFSDDHAQASGLSLLKEEETSTQSMVAYVGSDYNTGWMPGDIKLATLSSNDDTNLTGTELIDFSLSGTHNNGGQTSVTLSGSNIVITFVSGNPGWGGFAITNLTVGVKYGVEFNVSGTYGFFRIGTGPSVGTDYGTSTRSIIFEAFGITAYFNFGLYSNQGPVTVTNFSVRELAEKDHSISQNGASVYGTITKTAVATGADLVGYSGWSNSTNYLLIPADSFDVSTLSSFTLAFWAKLGPGAQSQSAVHSTAWRLEYNSSDQPRFLFYDGTNSVAYAGTAQPEGVWHQIVVTLSGTSAKMYINGRYDGQNNNGAFVMSNMTDNVKKAIGLRSDGLNEAFLGSLALMRFSASALSGEQIRYMYESERYLFQDNAQATLYGSSDAVTALAYDEYTKELHVGTSAGRSVFQGLSRVNNTTNGVGIAISASNGLAVDV